MCVCEYVCRVQSSARVHECVIDKIHRSLCVCVWKRVQNTESRFCAVSVCVHGLRSFDLECA